MSFKGDNTIGKLLTHNKKINLNKYMKCDVYRLTCQGCNKKYIGQTGGRFTQDFKSISKTLHIKMENKNSHISQTTGTPLHPWKTSWIFYM
jgi:transposase-like protein